MEWLITVSGWIVAAAMAISGYLYYIARLNRGASSGYNAEHSLARQTFYQFKANHFETILNACPDAVFITNDHGIITYVNPASSSMFGFTPEELLGQNVTVLMPEAIARFHHQYLIDFHLTGKTGTIGRRREIQCKHKDGALFPAELSLGASKEANKYLFIGIITDISERKNAEAKHRKSEQLREVLTNSTDCIMMLFTPDGVCKQANRAALKSLNQSEAETLGHHLSHFTDPQTASERLRCIQLALSSKESFIVYDEHQGRTFENIYTPIFDVQNEVSEIAVHACDITDRMAYEASLKQAKKAAEDANESKTLFISKISHELKNPLHAILGFAQIIKESLDEKAAIKLNADEQPTTLTELNNEQQQAIDTIIDSGSHILDLINDLLDISSAELDLLPVSTARLNAADLVNDIVHMMSPIARASEIDFTITNDMAEPWVLADNQRLKQVITNLISNAIKYSHRSGHIAVHTYAISQSSLAISVEDQGIGIPVHEQSDLFKVFTRASNGQQVSGNGLGLHLCKQLMNQMGGTIHFESKEHQGSRFWIELPIASETPPNNSPNNPSNNPPDNTVNLHTKSSKSAESLVPASLASEEYEMTLLVVEDNPSNARLIQKVTERIEGYRFFHASHCKEAKALLNQLQPDVLILDLNLPDGDGITLLTEGHSIPHTVVLSAFLSDEQPELSQHNIDLVLSKPVNIRQLTDSLNYWRDLHRSQSQTTLKTVSRS